MVHAKGESLKLMHLADEDKPSAGGTMPIVDLWGVSRTTMLPSFHRKQK